VNLPLARRTAAIVAGVTQCVIDITGYYGPVVAT